MESVFFHAWTLIGIFQEQTCRGWQLMPTGYIRDPLAPPPGHVESTIKYCFKDGKCEQKSRMELKHTGEPFRAQAEADHQRFPDPVITSNNFLTLSIVLKLIKTANDRRVCRFAFTFLESGMSHGPKPGLLTRADKPSSRVLKSLCCLMDNFRHWHCLNLTNILIC